MFTAFLGSHRIASGSMADIAAKLADYPVDSQVLIFDDTTGELTEPVKDEPRPVGRPKLGVVAREVTLLPRQWDWLATQPGGASVALRKLVEQARRTNEANDRIRLSREAAYRFMSALAGNSPNYEEALRALFAGDKIRFDALVADWPADVRTYAQRLAAPSFQ